MHGASTPSRLGWPHFAHEWEGDVSRVSVARCHISSKDIQSTVVLVGAKSGSALLDARVSVGQAKMKSLVWTTY